MEIASIRKVYIYTLSCPITHKVRYVGKTVKPLTRLNQHLIDAKNNKINCHKDNWLRKLIKDNLLPEFHIIDEIESSDWKWLEEYWILQFKVWGFDLTNMTNGGDGNNNQFRSLESKLKTSLTLKGKNRPQETKDKISLAHKGKIISDKTKEKLRQHNLGKIASEESKILKRKIVYCFENSELYKTFLSVEEAAKYFNCGKGEISNAISRDTKKFKGKYRLSYKDIVGQ